MIPSVDRNIAKPTSLEELSTQFKVMEVAPIFEKLNALGAVGTTGVKLNRVPEVIASVFALLAVPYAQVEEVDVALSVALANTVADVPIPIEAAPELVSMPDPYTKSILPVVSLNQHWKVALAAAVVLRGTVTNH